MGGREKGRREGGREEGRVREGKIDMEGAEEKVVKFAQVGGQDVLTVQAVRSLEPFRAVAGGGVIRAHPWVAERIQPRAQRCGRAH